MTRILSFALAFAAVANIAQAEGRAPRAGGEAGIVPVALVEGPRAPRAGGDSGVIVVEIATPGARRPKAGGETGLVVAAEPFAAEAARMLRRPKAGGATGLDLAAVPAPVSEPRRPRAGGKGGGAPGYAAAIAERRPRAGGSTVGIATGCCAAASDALVAGLERPAY